MQKFIYDGIVTGENFCSREDEIKKLCSYIKESTNVLLFAKRRMGKTSLVQEVFENHLDKKKFITIYVDIFDITDEYDFAKALYQAVSKSLKLDFKTALQTLKNIFQKSSFEMSIGADGNLAFSPKLVSHNYDELLEDIFNGLADYLMRHKLKAAFCIDEFQQVKQIKRPLDATIRKYIQRHHHICYIFTGSKRNTLAMLFKGVKSPLMGMVTPMDLGPINQEDFYFFAKEQLKELSADDFIFIYNEAEGESKLIQHICRNIYLLKIETGVIDISRALAMVVSEVDSLCRSIIEGLSSNGRKVVKMILESRTGDGLMAKDILQKYNISKSSVRSSLDSLIKAEIIFSDNDQYFIDGGIGSTFHLWCRHKLEEK